MNNTTHWIPTKKRFIAFLDIMGFKDMVMRYNHELIYEKLLKLSEVPEILVKLISGDSIYVTQFSDSIIIFSKDDSYTSFEQLSFMTCFVFTQALKLGMGIKGSIACGQITINKSKQIYFGQPLIDAYLLQEELAYYGVILHHSSENILKDHYGHDVIKYCDLPTIMKSGLISHFNLDWNYLVDDKIFILSELRSVDVIKNIGKTVSGGPRRYIDNTLNMIESFKQKRLNNENY